MTNNENFIKTLVLSENNKPAHFSINIPEKYKKTNKENT